MTMTGERSADGAEGRVSRGPPKEIRLLLPVWGHRYIRQFLDVGLPTLLAPGNLPALARALPCKLVFLTSASDGRLLRAHPGYKYLTSICDVEVEPIDDLITGDNYSTTITLAYARAVRAAGAMMRDTCFFFLISDYLIADGSLMRAFERIRRGASGVQAGNFQVVEQEASKTFYTRFDRGTPELVLPARELMGWALKYLHPMTAANTVNFPLTKSAHSNRLFWRVDGNTLIGRFYLMHMIAIRPEVDDFVIGSSCDYSFIPEMCPSNNVDILTDSDEYLVVEMQPFDHERHFQRLGPVVPAELAESLTEWTTARHRQNALSTIVYHAADIPDGIDGVIEEAGIFINKVASYLSPEPQPVRDHPYWIGAIAAHEWAKSQKLSKLGIAPSPAAGEAQAEAQDKSAPTFAHRVRNTIFGQPPNVRLWHPRWADYHLLGAEVSKLLLASSERRVLILSASPAVYSAWFSNVAATVTCLETQRLVNFNEEEYVPLLNSFDVCVLAIAEDELSQGYILLRRIRPLLVQGGYVFVCVVNGRGMGMTTSFGGTVTRYASFYNDLEMPIINIHFVQANGVRWGALQGMIGLFSGMMRYPAIYNPLAVVVGGFLLVGTVLGNLAARRPRQTVTGGSVVSSIGMTLKQLGEAALPDFAPPEDVLASGKRYLKALYDVDLVETKKSLTHAAASTQQVAS